MTRRVVADVEPMITLKSGRRVLLAVADLVASLEARGHVIAITDGVVTVSPAAVHPDTLFVLTSNHQDVGDILAARQASGKLPDPFGFDWDACEADLREKLAAALRPLLTRARRCGTVTKKPSKPRRR